MENKKDANKAVKLKVAESVQDDVNKGIVRIDSNLMYKIGARPGSMVYIKGERTTVAIVDRAYPGDIGLNIIRMDGLVRRNAKASIGDTVEVKIAEVKEAKQITIAPAQSNISIQAPPQVFKNGLLGRAMIKGDIVSIGGTKKRRSTMSDSPFFEDIFNLLDENVSSFGFSDIKFVVTDCKPGKEPVVVTENTEVIYNPESKAESLEEGTKLPDISYEDIGGLGEELSKVREMVELPLKHPEIFEKLGIEAPKGVLLHGPPGTGKTLLAKAVANETNSNFILINGPEIMGKYYGQSEENIRKTFEEAEKNSPSIIFIDEIDAIAPKREDSKGEVERRVVAQLLALMDGLNTRGKVMVLAATNRPNSIDQALRRPGRFDREIEIGVPNREGREAIMKIHTRSMPIVAPIKKNYVEDKILHLQKEIKNLEIKIKKTDNEERQKSLTLTIEQNKEFIKSLQDLDTKLNMNDKENEQIYEHLPDQLKDKFKKVFLEGMLSEISEVTHGFVGADLKSLSKEAAMVVLRKMVPDLDLKKDEPIPEELLNKLIITNEDFQTALRFVRPSAMREVLIEVPNIKWKDIGGLEEVKQEIKEAVEWPLKHKEAFDRLGVKPPKGVLLYGPPGCGKTLLAKAVATESSANFISVKGPELISKWVGESEKGIREIFSKARQTAPCIVFFDEIDAIVPRRGSEGNGSKVTERMVNQFLTEMDGVEEMQDVVVIGATNRPDMIDPALMRTGRFDRVILAPIPDSPARKQIFEVQTKHMKLGNDISLDVLADKTNNYTGADIEGLVREAAMHALRSNMDAKEVSMKDFEIAMERVMPSVSKEVSDLYDTFKKEYSSARSKEFQEAQPSYFG